MNTTVDPFEELARLFLTEPDGQAAPEANGRKPAKGSQGPDGTAPWAADVELIVVGSLPSAVHDEPVAVLPRRYFDERVVGTEPGIEWQRRRRGRPAVEVTRHGDRLAVVARLNETRAVAAKKKL